MSDLTMDVRSEDSEMNGAIAQARATLNQFLDAFESPQPNQQHFLVKARFQEGASAEHIWLADLDFSTYPATGTVANEPDLTWLKYLERASFTPDQVTDWMYEEDGRLVGGFTTRLLQRRSEHPN